VRKRDIPEHKIWDAMIQRCTNPKNPMYRRYGGRGINVCESWRVFENFYRDMGPRPNGLEIDRICNDSGYEPSNCRWATRKQQQNNTSRNVVIKHEGKEQTVSQWADEIGINANTITYRLRRGWTNAEALSVKKEKGWNARKAQKLEIEKESRRRTCTVCGNQFYPRPYQIRIGQGKTCSSHCRMIHIVNLRTDLKPETIINRIERGIIK